VTKSCRASLAAGVCFAVSTCALSTEGADAATARSRLAFGFEVSGSFAPEDAAGFNDTSYGQNALRLLRLTAVGSLRLGEHVAILADARSDGLESLYLQGLYVRLRPWRLRELDIQAGRIPPVFGSWARRRYASDNPVIGYPLAYQYLVSVPGGLTPTRQGAPDSYPRARATYSMPLPVVALTPWDTGIEIRVGHRLVDLAASLTQGTLSRPRFEDDNGGKQVAARVSFRVAPGVVTGASFARGEWPPERSATLAAPRDADPMQTAWGFDAELSAGHAVLRAELIHNTWDVVPGGSTEPLRQARCLAAFAEALWRLSPRLRLGGRVDHISFGQMEQEPAYGKAEPWGEPLTRAEVAVGFAPHRRVLLKAAYQHNWQQAAAPGRRGLVAVQAVFWR
jgi:hypothetical protein